MIKTTHIEIRSEFERYGYMCSKCGHSLGLYEKAGEVEHDDTDGWNFCPYCGSEL